VKMDVDDRSAAVRRRKERISAVSRRKMWLAMGRGGGYCSRTSALSVGSAGPMVQVQRSLAWVAGTLLLLSHGIA
jgi:hypothetical protein